MQLSFVLIGYNILSCIRITLLKISTNFTFYRQKERIRNTAIQTKVKSNDYEAGPSGNVDTCTTEQEPLATNISRSEEHVETYTDIVTDSTYDITETNNRLRQDNKKTDIYGHIHCPEDLEYDKVCLQGKGNSGQADDNTYNVLNMTKENEDEVDSYYDKTDVRQTTTLCDQDVYNTLTLKT